jgi:hypothetical protein
VADRLLRLLDHPFLARLQAALFVGTVLVPALALFAAGVIAVMIGVVTAVAWQLLIAPTVALFLIFWWLLGRAYRRFRSEPSVEARVTGFLWEDRPDTRLIVQIELVVFNVGPRPTRLSRWQLSGRLAYADRYAAHLRGWQRFEGREPIIKLDESTADNPLAPGEERDGYVSFAFIDATSDAIREAALTLSVCDDRGKRSAAAIDIPALRALGEHTVSAKNREREAEDNALWLSGQLAAGNALLERWRMSTPSHNVQGETQEAADWERTTRDGLAERLPAYRGLFGLDVGLGQEFIFSPIEVQERTRLRRRLHRLGEIADRYSREQSR